MVNEELNAGIWVAGYDTAVAPQTLDHEKGLELLEVVLANQPEQRIDLADLASSIETALPQSAVASVSWIIADDATFVMTDSLRVARFRKSHVIWTTPRIALDGIALKEIRNGKILGLAWHGSELYGPDEEFTLDFESGAVLSGSVDYRSWETDGEES